MSDRIEDITMYAGQWSPMSADNVYTHQNRNTPIANNADILQNQQYLISHQTRQPDLYPGGMHYSNTDAESSESGQSSHASNVNNYNSVMYDRVNPNVNLKYNPMDPNSGQVMNPEMFNDQYNMMNKYEVYNHDMEQYKHQQYAMMYNAMKHSPNQHQIAEGLNYSPEHVLSSPSVPLHHPCLSSSAANGEPAAITQKSPLIDSFLGNWTSNPSGTYTPFGHSFLNVQPNLLLQKENLTPNTKSNNTTLTTDILTSSSLEADPIRQSEPFQRKDSDNISFSDIGGKKRIVAEVKPMRPSYSAVLSKTPKTNNSVESNKKKDSANKEFVKPSIKLSGNKQEKFKNQNNFNEKLLATDERVKKMESEKRNSPYSQVSSGSESGEIHTDSSNKANKSKTKSDNNRKYISLDDLMNDDDAHLLEEKPGYNNCDSEFVFLTQPEDKTFLRKRNSKKADIAKIQNGNINESDVMGNDGSEDTYFDQSIESDKSKRKNKESKSNARKIFAEKNKKNSQSRNKKAKSGGYMGKLQNLFDRWLLVMKNILIWFYNLLSDIFRMSAQLSLDFASVSCRNTYTWSLDFCTSIKDKATSPQWLKDFVNYIDKKMGHTWVGFWRNMKFLNFLKFDDDKNTQKQSNLNIPLPATGDEAMKRLLACKGKDPYSILGVGAQCSDEDIKKYYRRQAFLVHPDKNQQPGAEEAFKILQHAFDLIGEPARREAYDRKLVESAQMEAALSEVAELLAQLQDKVKHAAGTIRCTNCCRRHVRTITTRPAYAARYCQQCKIRHAAKEGDIWAESQLWGLVWKYYACMDGAVYQITQWASCQKKNLKHLVANTHHVQYRIVLGNNKTPPNTSTTAGNKQNFNSTHDANLEDFLNNLYSKSGQPSGETRNATTPNSTEVNKNRRKTKKSKT